MDAFIIATLPMDLDQGIGRLRTGFLTQPPLLPFGANGSGALKRERVSKPTAQ